MKPDYQKMPDSSKRMLLELHLGAISKKEQQFRLSLIRYWLSDFDFADTDPENDITFAFSAILRTFENENNPKKRQKVFREWFSLLGIYFLNEELCPAIPATRSLDLAGFCLFVVDNFMGGLETSMASAEFSRRQLLSQKGNDTRYASDRELRKAAIHEYPKAVGYLLGKHKKLTYESAAKAVWTKLSVDMHPARVMDIRKEFNNDVVGRMAGWFERAAGKGLIKSTTALRKTPSP